MAEKVLKEPIDTEKFTTTKDAENALESHKDTLCRKVKQQLQVKDAKKEAMGAYNEQLKELNEEIDHEIGVLDSLTDRVRVLSKKLTVV